MTAGPSTLASTTGLIGPLRSLAVRGLAQMYRADEQCFVFRVRRSGAGVVSEGRSRRYTAIVLIGLASDRDREIVLSWPCRQDVCARLVRETRHTQNLGDVALTLWAATALGHPDRRAAWEHLGSLRPTERPYAVVELSWALAALCLEEAAPLAQLRDRLARRLIAAFEARSGIFPHVVGANTRGLRSHVSCFADLVYPAHALAQYFRVSGYREALDVALQCARQMCRLQGASGQWWWHYDCRTGAVIERYPVYAVHQDAMAPMALFAVQDASGANFDAEIGRGLRWLAHAPELGGRSLIDEAAGLIWRKVARREPRKLARYAQSLVSRLHPTLRVPGLDRVLPPSAVDYEDRPYHLGWVLYAWPVTRLQQWDAAVGQ